MKSKQGGFAHPTGASLVCGVRRSWTEIQPCFLLSFPCNQSLLSPSQESDTAHGCRDPPVSQNIKARRLLRSGLFAGAEHESGTCLRLQRLSNEKCFCQLISRHAQPFLLVQLLVADVGTCPCAPAMSSAIPRWRKPTERLHAISSAFFFSSFLFHQAPSASNHG